ncbi:MAG: alpha-glucuronidase family glycosyl hydrolase [Limnochordia bacterium]|jgi:alpha-glucuronidase|nr:alpha-glucuronidase family glycosyl hydrolase [Bacillota bacterium]
MATNYRNLRDYGCWLQYDLLPPELLARYGQQFEAIAVKGGKTLTEAITEELRLGLAGLLGTSVSFVEAEEEASLVVRLEGEPAEPGAEEAFRLQVQGDEGSLRALVSSTGERGLLYGTFAFLRALQLGEISPGFKLEDGPSTPLRLINHWDNLDGSVERGYAGKSIFFRENRLVEDLERVRDYARLLASIGINGVAVNNVNVHQEETQLIASKLAMVKTLSSIFRGYGIRLFLSINFASPWEFGLDTADPLEPQVQQWWKERVAAIYSQIPDLGGFLVKADSEHRPGPFTYGRTHAEGANMLGEALKPYGGVVIWRCFVYNCQQDWRDTQTDRARAAYDHFQPLDGQFMDNVILQIKNGPMDFQVREPVSPLFGGLERTNQILELQITQEYTGQQRHLCYLVPMWKEVLDFDTYARGEGSTVARIAAGAVFPMAFSGIAGVSNVGSDPNWTGHTLAQANLYGYGRLAWNPGLSTERITREWAVLTFGHDPEVVQTVSSLLLGSWEAFENYTVPLGIGWMCNPGHHYGPSPEGYEFSRWGTYHRADRTAIGVDRTVQGGTGFAGQYRAENARLYESLESCPEELLLFFHRIPYTHVLRSGKTLIQHIYDTHFRGVEQVEEMISRWEQLAGKVHPETFSHVRERLEIQLVDAKEWRDVINTYFYRLTHIPDARGRKIYT